MISEEEEVLSEVGDDCIFFNGEFVFCLCILGGQSDSVLLTKQLSIEDLFFRDEDDDVCGDADAIAKERCPIDDICCGVDISQRVVTSTSELLLIIEGMNLTRALRVSLLKCAALIMLLLCPCFGNWEVRRGGE